MLVDFLALNLTKQNTRRWGNLQTTCLSEKRTLKNSDNYKHLRMKINNGESYDSEI
jgi:hypothetical protein